MVEINKAGTKYSINKYEVTQEEWEAVMGRSKNVSGAPHRPIKSVSWYECHTFINKLNEQTLTVQKLVDKIDELLRGLTNENK